MTKDYALGVWYIRREAYSIYQERVGHSMVSFPQELYAFRDALLSWLKDVDITTAEHPRLTGMVDEPSYRAGFEAAKSILMERKYDAMKDGRLDLTHFDIRTIEPQWPL